MVREEPDTPEYVFESSCLCVTIWIYVPLHPGLGFVLARVYIAWLLPTLYT